jgi:hypothetical protein
MARVESHMLLNSLGNLAKWLGKAAYRASGGHALPRESSTQMHRRDKAALLPLGVVGGDAHAPENRTVAPLGRYFL